MNREQFQRVEELFDAAMALPPERRIHHVAAMGADDPVVLARVSKMIENAERELHCDQLAATQGLAPSSIQIDDLTGESIGPFVLRERIGEGGFGVVYRAEQTAPIQRIVALKIVKLGMDTAQVIARFQAERQALALMDHPHIAKVFDAGVTDRGRPFFVMELVPGDPITRYCDEKRLDIESRLRLFIRVCQAVQHAHHKGVIHRDLKPSNVLISDQDGEPMPKIIDFGIAKATHGRLADRTVLTEVRQFIGTPEYMSPEQASIGIAGSPSCDVDTRSDIYSLGVLLNELLVGATPFDRSSSTTIAGDALLKLIREKEPRRPSHQLSALGDRAPSIARDRATEPVSLRKALQGDLDWIVLKAMAKRPDDRYDTAADLAHEIERYLTDQPITARPPGVWYLARKFINRHQVAVGAAAMIALATLAGLMATLISLHEANEAREQQQEALASAEARLWDSLLAQARAARSSNEIGRRADALTALAHAAAMKPGDRLRDEAIASMLLADFYPVQSLPTYAQVGASGLRTIDRVADIRRRGEIVVINTNDGTDRATLQTPELYCWIMAFSPDGQYVGAKFHDNPDDVHVNFWNIDDPHPRLAIPDEGEGIGRFEILQIDGRTLAAVTMGRTQLHLYDIESGQRIAQTNLSLPIFGAAADRSGSRLAISHFEGRAISILDTRTLETQLQFPTPAAIRGLAFTGDGDSLLGCGNDYNLYQWDARTGEQTRVFRGHQGEVVDVFINRDSTLAASFGWDNTTRLWDLATGSPFLQPLTNARVVGFADDLAVDQLGKTTIWRFEPGAEFTRIRTSAPHRAGFAAHINSPGNLVVTADDDGARLWSVSERKLLATLISRRAIAARFENDGNHLITADTESIQRWPLISNNGDATVGHPETLWQGSELWACHIDANDHYLVIFHGQIIDVLEFKTLKHLSRLSAFRGLTAKPAVDPAGRWLFTPNWRGDAARVWDLSNSEAVKHFPAISALGAFNADGSRLIVSTGSLCEILETGSWQTRHSIRRNHVSDLAGQIAVAHNTNLAAITDSRFEVLLLDIETGRLLARISAPEPAAITGLCFSANGDSLVATTTIGELHIWNLGRIHSQLARINLQW